MRIKIFLIISILMLTLALFSCSSDNGDLTWADTASITDMPTTDATDAITTEVVTEAATTENIIEETPKADWEADGVLRILTIGNSFSDDTMQYVYQIAKDLGVEKVSLGNLYIGGCSLATHASNAAADKAAYEYRTNTSGTWSTVKEYKMSDAIKSQDWDFISLQQASGSSGIESTYSSVAYMIKYVQKLAPNAKLVWNMTWAYQQNTTHSDFPKYGSDQMKMYNAILNAVASKIKTNDNFVYIVPNGTAIQNARTSYIGDHITRDGYHLSYDFGRYIAGLTFISKLTGLSVENVGFAPEGVDENKKLIAIESAMNAIASPDGVTNSVYVNAPGFNPDDYDVLEIKWTPLGYWNATSASNHHKIIKTASNSNQFYASPMYTKEDIPVGSVIVLADGWRYRPEAWKTSGVQSSRPAITTESMIFVTEAWWGSYTHRAFNLAKVGAPALKGNMTEIEGAFTIYIPKK